MKVISYKDTAENLKQKMMEKKLSASKLSDMLNIYSTQAVYSWRSGNTLPRIETMLNLCEILGCTVEELLVTREVQEGTWHHCEGEIKCSECCSSFFDEIMDLCGSDVPKFCPDCGAKMFEEPKRLED